MAFAGINVPMRAPAVLLFLALAPGAAVASLLPGLDPFGRLLVAGTAALVINATVAVGLLAAGAWSPRGGVAIVALVAAAVAATGLLPLKRGRSA